LSVVVPCYNEAEVIDVTVPRLLAMADSMGDLRTELLFVDDGSRDSTLRQLKAWAARDARIKVLSFARNFGHQVAVTAGIDAARGDAVVLIDADLE